MYGYFHYKDKTVVVVRPSYLYDWNSYTGKTASLYWDKCRVLDYFSINEDRWHSRFMFYQDIQVINSHVVFEIYTFEIIADVVRLLPAAWNKKQAKHENWRTYFQSTPKVTPRLLCKTAVSPVRLQWRYRSLELSYRIMTSRKPSSGEILIQLQKR